MHLNMSSDGPREVVEGDFQALIILRQRKGHVKLRFQSWTPPVCDAMVVNSHILHFMIVAMNLLFIYNPRNDLGLHGIGL